MAVLLTRLVVKRTAIDNYKGLLLNSVFDNVKRAFMVFYVTFLACLVCNHYFKAGASKSEGGTLAPTFDIK